MQQFPKISEVIDLLNKTEPTGSDVDRFARGGSELKKWRLLRGTDYFLTACYVSMLGFALYSLIKAVV